MPRLAAAGAVLMLSAMAAQALDRMEFTAPEGSASVGLVRTSGTAGFDEGGAAWRSKLEFPVDGWLVEIQGSARRALSAGRQPGYITIRGRYAASLSMEGRSSDYDWAGSGQVSDYSHSDCTADARLWDIKAEWSMVFDNVPATWTTEVGLHIGYGGDWFDFSDENLDAVYDYGQTVYSVPGPSATYEIEFTGIRLGGFAELRPSEVLTFRAELDWIPNLHAEADALWILRDYPFWQEADGQGLVARVRGDWALSPVMSLFGGVRYVQLVADENGVERGVLDGTAYEDTSILWELTAEYVGVEVGAAWQF